MKTSVKDNKLLATLMISTLMITFTPMAFADPAPLVATVPDPVTTGITQVKLKITGGTTHTDMKVRVFEENTDPVTPGTGTLATGCNLATPPGMAWTLVEKDSAIPLKITLSSGAIVLVPFGGAGEFTSASMTSAGSPTYSATDAEWREVAVASFNTDAVSQTVGDYHYYHLCMFETSTTLQINVLQPFEIVAPVAGTILPIDTSALMIAGITSTIGIWILPVLGSAGFAVYVVSKKLV